MKTEEIHTNPAVIEDGVYTAQELVKALLATRSPNMEMLGIKLFVPPQEMTIQIDESNQMLRFVVPFIPRKEPQP